MKRFFLIPLLALLLTLAGCTCTASGNVTTPTKAPSAVPTKAPTPTATIQPTMNVTPDVTVAPVTSTEPVASPTADTTAGTGNP